jgi:hypothetical protein
METAEKALEILLSQRSQPWYKKIKESRSTYTTEAQELHNIGKASMLDACIFTLSNEIRRAKIKNIL